MPEPHPNCVPGAEEAVAEERKFTEYLLNDDHPIGRGKAKWFKRAGYTTDNWRELRSGFLTQLPYVESWFVRENVAGGLNYEAQITVAAPNGEIQVRTFWEVHPESGTRLITAYRLDLDE